MPGPFSVVGAGAFAMDMSAEEVKQFWRDFCQRRKVDPKIIALGDAKITADPDYWADQTMQDLLDLVMGKTG